jgi:hypothetical protein
MSTLATRVAVVNATRSLVVTAKAATSRVEGASSRFETSQSNGMHGCRTAVERMQGESRGRGRRMRDDFEQWTVPQLVAAARLTGVKFSLDERGELAVEGVTRATPSALLSSLTGRWAEIQAYLRSHPEA